MEILLFLEAATILHTGGMRCLLICWLLAAAWLALVAAELFLPTLLL